MKTLNLLHHPAKPVILLSLFLICVFLASGCAASPEEQATQTAQAQTATAAGWTATHTPKPTLTFTPTITPTFTPSNTATAPIPTPEPTQTSTLEPELFVPISEIASLDECPRLKNDLQYQEWMQKSKSDFELGQNKTYAPAPGLQIMDDTALTILFPTATYGYSDTPPSAGAHASCAWMDDIDGKSLLLIDFPVNVRITGSSERFLLHIPFATEPEFMQQLTEKIDDSIHHGYEYSPINFLLKLQGQVFTNAGRTWVFNLPKTTKIRSSSLGSVGFLPEDYSFVQRLLDSLPPRYFVIIQNLGKNGGLTLTEAAELQTIFDNHFIPGETDSYGTEKASQ
jgi:hypothetical protein